MIYLGLIGYPLGHSLSPKLHNTVLQYYDLQGEYSLYPIEPDDLQSLKSVLGRVRSGIIHGLSVTIPHKQNVIQFLDELTSTAKSIGAVNTIYLRNHKLIGDNTDAPGFLCDLKRFLPTETHTCPGGRCQGRHRESHALVLGAGGAARAVIYALLHDGWNVTIAARRLEQAEQLVTFFAQHELRITDYQLSNIELSNISLIVNTTPVGMAPNINQSPWPENLPFHPHAAIYDLVYNPRETKLMKDACSQGLYATNGLGMLIEQAALAFEIWTGRKPPHEAMFEAINQTAH